MLADPLLMSGAARLPTDTKLEHCAIVVLVLFVMPVVFTPLVVEVWVPGPVVVTPERKEYPCFSAADRYGTVTTNAASSIRAATIRAAALWDLRAGAGVPNPPSTGNERPVTRPIFKQHGLARPR